MARSFKDASPWEIRAALIPEEQADFDVTRQAAMTEAAQTLDLAGVFRTWTRGEPTPRSPLNSANAGYRRWLARVERIAHTGETPPGTAPLADVKALLEDQRGT